MPPTTYPFLGMRGTGDWVDDARPKNWRETMLYLYPNGSVTLTAMMSMMRSESTDDPQFHWWTKSLPGQYAEPTGVYTDILSTAYDGTSAADTGSVLYLKLASDQDARQFRTGHVLRMVNQSDGSDGCNASVLQRVQNGSSSYLQVRLLSADTDGAFGAATNKAVLIVGTTHPEGDLTPESISYDPVKLFNYTQIHRTTYDITRTARKTRMRTGDPFKELRRENLEIHGIEIEKSYLWGVPAEWQGANNKPERSSAGLTWFIENSAPDNVFNYATDPAYAGTSWLNGGKDWLNERLEQIFRYGSEERVVFAGSGAVLGINQLAEEFGTINMQVRQAAWGIRVEEWVTPFGVIYLKRHPLFSYLPATRNMMIAFEPQNLRERYIDQTQLYKDDKKDGGFVRYDATKEEYLTETGLEMHHPITAGLFYNVGADNSYSA